MKRLSIFAVAVAAVATTWSAHAVVLDARFSGTVGSQTNTGFARDAPIAGEFFFDTDSAKYLSFSIGDQSVAPGFASTAAITPDQYSAIYRAQLSPVQQGGTLNSTFTLDLEGLNKWPSLDAVAVLTNTSQLASNLDTSASSFGFYSASSDGTGVRSVSAALNAFQVSAVPEPSSTALLLVGVAAAGLRRVRRLKR